MLGDVDESNQEESTVRVPTGRGKNVSPFPVARYQLQRADFPRSAFNQAIEHHMQSMRAAWFEKRVEGAP